MGGFKTELWGTELTECKVMGVQVKERRADRWHLGLGKLSRAWIPSLCYGTEKISKMGKRGQVCFWTKWVWDVKAQAKWIWSYASLKVRNGYDLEINI